MQIINKYKNAQKHEKQTATPWEKNYELQRLNKQHIKNEGISIIAYPHSKPQIYSRVAICQSIAVLSN